MDFLGRGESRCKGPGEAHRPACVRKSHTAGWGDEVREVGRPLWEKGVLHNFSSLPVPSLLQWSPAQMTRLSFSPVAARQGSPWTAHHSPRSWPGFQGRSSQPGQPRGPLSICRRPHALPRAGLRAQLPCCCYSWKLPQKHCTPNRCWRPGPCLLPPQQDTPARATTMQEATLPSSARRPRTFHITSFPGEDPRMEKTLGRREEEPQGQGGDWRGGR